MEFSPELVAKISSPEEEAKNYKERFQFQLKRDDKIIIQRYFKINDFNEESLESLDLKRVIDDIVGDTDKPVTVHGQIKHDLKVKSRMFLWERYDPTYSDRVDPISNIYERLGDEVENVKTGEITREKVPYQEYYHFVFLVDEKPVITRIFDGNVYPVLIRKKINITDLVYSICSKLSYVCSKPRCYKIANKFDYELAFKKDKSKEQILTEKKKYNKWESNQLVLMEKYLKEQFEYNEPIKKRK